MCVMAVRRGLWVVTSHAFLPPHPHAQPQGVAHSSHIDLPLHTQVLASFMGLATFSNAIARYRKGEGLV